MFLFMGPSRNQSLPAPTFFLTGIPGLEGSPVWVSTLFCSLYVVALLGNGAVLVVIVKDRGLRKPMYLFLSMLAVSELGVSLTTLPTVLGVFLFGAREIGLDACLAQMFFLHSFTIMDSGVLWAMALDHFVAIYSPLQYSAILTNFRILLMDLGIATRSFLLIIPLPLLLQRLPFLPSNLLAHPYCLHPNLIRLPCADTSLNSRVGLFILLCSFGLDSACIVVSYAMILKTVLGMASKEGRLRALNPCVSHICAVLAYYVPMTGVSLAHRFGRHASPLLHSLMAHIYLLVPPVVNPIIYQIRRALGRLFSPRQL